MDPVYDLYHAHTDYAAQAALYAHHVHAAKKGTQALLLEWGCRTGSLLAQWPRFGWEAVGIEPCPALGKKAWAKGLQVVAGSYYRPPLLGAAPAAAVIRYPVVSCAGLTPACLRRFLRAVRAVLEPGGTVVLDMITIGWREPAGIGFPGPVGGGVDGVGGGGASGGCPAGRAAGSVLPAGGQTRGAVSARRNRIGFRMARSLVPARAAAQTAGSANPASSGFPGTAETEDQPPGQRRARPGATRPEAEASMEHDARRRPEAAARDARGPGASDCWVQPFPPAARPGEWPRPAGSVGPFERPVGAGRWVFDRTTWPTCWVERSRSSGC